ncbi:hypothetical protein QRN89_20930 [Streptomyces chengbuensis]|uniref:hypothetical protein n=1 Tax=Streptomyces TaxID=1883 RepID=UPI0025B37FF7|nr:hypothetical protein [Streptomyces sp. HUAS CB01]WJY52043.1 hypothetical protein QRN89_20930 [Streptomyces sp. HUAS CB01]
MPASENETQSRPKPSPRPSPAFSMRDLLASCAAASAVSTPPRDRGGAVPTGEVPEVAEVGGEQESRRDAA